MAAISIFLMMPVFMAFGFFGLILLTVPLVFGTLLQLIFCIVSEKRWVILVPATLGGSGLVISLACLLDEIPLKGILIYWAIYFLCLWLIWLIVDQIKKFI